MVKIIEGNYGKCYICDNMDENVGLPSLKNKSLDLCLTDPPYGINYNSNYYKNGNPNPKIKNDDKILSKWINIIFKILTKNSSFFCFTRFDVLQKWIKIIQQNNFILKNVLVWVKNNWSAGDLKGNFGYQYENIIYATKGRVIFNGKRNSNVIYCKRVPPNIWNHQTPKPIKLIKKIIHTIIPKSVIDPFLGSGTCAEVCEELGIKWIGYEISKDYIQDIEKRIQNGIKKHKQYNKPYNKLM